MKANGIRRAAAAASAAAVFACLGAALVLSGQRDGAAVRELGKTLEDRRSADARERLAGAVEEALGPQARMADGRRGTALLSVARTAEDPRLVAWISGRPPRNPRGFLEAICADRGWVSALVADRRGRVLGSWPGKSAGSLAGDPYFRALSAPGMGPGLVRHGYERLARPSRAGGAFRMAAACGVADATGAFGGLLEVRLDARAVLFGGRAAPMESVVRSFPGSEFAYATGDGRDLFDSSGTPGLGRIAGWTGLASRILTEPVGSVAAGDGLLVWSRVGAFPVGGDPADALGIFLWSPLPAQAAGPEVAEGPSLRLPWGGSLELPAAWSDPAVRGWVAAAAAALLAALLLLASLGSAPAAEARPPDPAAAPDPAASTPDHGAELGLLKQLQDELALAKDSLKESQLERDRELAQTETLRAQAEGLRGELESARAAASKASEEALEARRGARELEERLSRRASEPPEPSGKDLEVARLAAVTTLSEELKALLEVIRNYINGLLGGQGAFGDAQQEFLGLVINKSARLERLVGDLSDLSEAALGAGARRQETAPLASLIQEALVNVRPQAENKGVALDWDEQAAPQTPVRVDREKVSSLLRGLLAQAVKVTPRNGRVGMSLEDQGGVLKLKVADQGQSLTPERAAKAFSQFHGVDSQAGPEFVGAGLRFVVLKGIAEAQGGSIGVEAAPGGKGKVFVLTLPKAAGPVVPVAAAPVELPLPVPAEVEAPRALGSALPFLPDVEVVPAYPEAPLASSGLPGDLPALEGLPLESPAPVAGGGAPAVRKPAPLDDTFNAPWKRKESKLSDDLDELMSLSGVPAPPKVGVPTPPPVLAAEAPAPAPAAPAPPKPPLPASSDFDALFGPPPGAPPAGGLNNLDDLNRLLGQ